MLHVGSMGYVGTFGGSGSVVLECLVNPRNVVSVPTDYHNTKMRVCEYYPFAISNGENENIYLESDYSAFDKEQMKKELVKYELEKRKWIDQLEKELAEKKAIAGGLL